jgi:hypothetical protein
VLPRALNVDFVPHGGWSPSGVNWLKMHMDWQEILSKRGLFLIFYAMMLSVFKAGSLAIAVFLSF